MKTLHGWLRIKLSGVKRAEPKAILGSSSHLGNAFASALCDVTEFQSKQNQSKKKLLSCWLCLMINVGKDQFTGWDFYSIENLRDTQRESPAAISAQTSCIRKFMQLLPQNWETSPGRFLSYWSHVWNKPEAKTHTHTHRVAGYTHSKCVWNIPRQDMMGHVTGEHVQ